MYFVMQNSRSLKEAFDYKKKITNQEKEKSISDLLVMARHEHMANGIAPGQKG